MVVKWKGTFEYDYPLEGDQPVDFEMEVNFEGEQFSGKLVDEEFGNLTGDSCSVEGVLKDEWIQFTQRYPYQFDELEDGTLFIDGNAAGHEVDYTGVFNPATNRWEGRWHILPKEEDDTLIEEEELDSGIWYMSRVSSPM